MLSSPASSSLFGDYIGLESCVDLRDDNDDDDDDGDEEELSSGNGGRRRGDRSGEMKEKEFPPAIPWLAQTGNLISHMPWVMKRYHTSDGRLIIRVEKVKHHEYFRAHRANGRLTLHLIPMDNDFHEGEEEEAEEEDDEGNAEKDDDGEKGEGEGEGEEKGRKEEKESVKSSCIEMSGGDGGGSGGGVGGSGGKCCMMNSISSCMFGMAVAAIKPVYI